MITCTLGDKRYSVDFISSRALREMEPAAKMYGRIVAISNATLKGETVDAGNLIARAKAMIPLLVPLFVSAFRRTMCWITIPLTG